MIALAALCLAGALAVALLLLLAGRALGWRRRTRGIARPWLLAIWILLTIGLSVALADGTAQLDHLGWMLLGGWLVASILLHLRRGSPQVAQRWGAHITHGGVALAIGGLILSSLFTSSIERVVAPGDTIRFQGWTVRLHELWPAAGGDWAGVAAELRASRGSGAVLLEPQLRTGFDRSIVSEPASTRNGGGALTARLGPRASDGDWPIRLSWTPLLLLIPMGGIIAALGGAVALAGPGIARWRRARRVKLATAWWG